MQQNAYQQVDPPLSGSNTWVFIAEYGFRCKNRVPDRNPGLAGKCREIVVGTVRLRFCRSHGDCQAPPRSTGRFPTVRLQHL